VNGDGSAQWLTWLGVLIVLIAAVLGVWLQVVLPTTSGGPGGYEATQRLIYVVQSVLLLTVGVVVIALGRILAALNARGEGENPSTTLDGV
jgi:hypothetical protein